MLKYYILILLFFNLFFNAHAKFEKSDSFTLNVWNEYDDCRYINIKKKIKFAIKYDTDIYLDSYRTNIQKSLLKCNKIFEKLIDKEFYSDGKNINFNKLVNEAIANNASIKKNLYIKIYNNYHSNLYWHSDDIEVVKKALDEIENNYLSRSDTNTNMTAVEIIGDLGWFYNIKNNFIDFNKARNYLTKATKYHKDDYNLKYYYNNLGVIYDQDRATNNSIKENNKIAFKLYSKAAKLGLHYAYNNVAKFYLLGLGGAKQNYEKSIKNYKFARITSSGDDDFSNLAILYKKKRVPKNINEYLTWLEEYIIQNQVSSAFQQVAWIMGEKIDQGINTKKEIYKWQYLCSIHCESFADRDRAITEMHILEIKSLSKEQVEIAKLDAKKWEDKSWNISIDTNVNKILKKKEKTLVDFIRNAFIKK